MYQKTLPKQNKTKNPTGYHALQGKHQLQKANRTKNIWVSSFAIHPLSIIPYCKNWRKYIPSVACCKLELCLFMGRGEGQHPPRKTPQPYPGGWLCGAPSPRCWLCAFTSKPPSSVGIGTRDLGKEIRSSRCTRTWTTEEPVTLSSWPT